VSYENYLHKKHSNTKDGVITPDLSTEEMKAMLDAVRNKK
jgi:hypothetical protein